MRIATWNLDHASSSRRPKALQLEKIAQVNPDILVLTETCREVDLAGYGYYPPLYSIANEYGKHCSALWSKYPIVKHISTYDPESAICAVVDTPLGHLIVYGTILTYHGDKGPLKSSPQWYEHHRAIKDHGDDWCRIMKHDVDSLPLIVLGDFNQTRDGSQAYCSRRGESIKLLDEELWKNKLICLTEENFGESGKLSVDPKKGYPRNNIDHICISMDRFKSVSVGAWDHFDDNGRYLTDHNGVYVDLRYDR